MLKTKVIQNYYERFGNFDKVQNTFTGKLLEDIKDPYETLGYVPIQYKQNTYSAKDVHDLRLAYLAEDTDIINTKFGFRSLEEVAAVLKSGEMLPKKLGDIEVKVSNTLSQYVDMLSEYYRNSNSYVAFKDNYLPLKVALASMKFQQKAIKENVKELISNNGGVLVSVECGERPLVYGRKLYVTKGLSKKQVETLHSKAMLKAAAFGTQIPEKFIKNPLALFMVSFSDVATYLNLLETAELEGKTYAQFMESTGFHVPNCESMYKELGIILAIVGQNAVVLSSDKENKDSVFYTTDLEAKQLCSQFMNR